MDRFFVEELLDASGAVLSFGVMDRDHPEEIVIDVPTRAEAEASAEACNLCPDDYDPTPFAAFAAGERRFCLGIEVH